MNFLLNPDVAYILLVFGFLVAVLALFSPGTGVLEILALFALALAGYSIINLPMNWWALVVMVAGILPFLFALRWKDRRRVFLLLASALAFVFGSAFLFRGEGWRPAVNLLLVLLMSPIAVGLSWLMANKTLEAINTRPAFDLDRLVGMSGQASSDIRGQGTVYVNGEEWTAVSQSFIPAGSPIKVIRREGLALVVELHKG